MIVKFMTENNIKSNAPQTPEAVAYKLMGDVLVVRTSNADWVRGAISLKLSTEDILNTYKQCLAAVKGN